MKILFVSDTYYPHLNGVYYFVCRIGPLLQARGHEIAVIAPSVSYRPSLEKIDNLDVYGVPSMPVLFYPNVRVPVPLGLKKRLRKLLRDLRPDVIHVQDHFALGKAMVEVSREFGIPLLGTNHFMPENLSALVRSPRLRPVIEKVLWRRFAHVYNRIDVITTPTETGAALIRPRLRTRVSALSSGVDFSQFNPGGSTGAASPIRAKYSLPDKPIVLFVGRIDPEKHIEEIIEAVVMTAEKNDICLAIVGKGVKKAYLEELVRNRGLSDLVRFTGFVSDEDLPLLYQESHCFAISSIAELLSLATLQAMASGLPVVAANAGALGEVVRHGENGYLYPPGDVATFSQYLSALLADSGLHARMSRRSVDLSKVHDIHYTVEAFETLYEQVTADAQYTLHAH